jgi:hypothetical protein
MNNPRRDPRRDREVLRYLDALEAGDLDTVAALWEQAAGDPELERLLNDLNEGLFREEQAAHPRPAAERDAMRNEHATANQRGWKQDVPTAVRTPPGPQRVWQREKEPAGAVRAGWSRRRKLGLVCGGLCATLAALVLVVWWLRPPRPLALVLVGAGYEDNLAVAPNVYGLQGLEDLQALAASRADALSWNRASSLSIRHAAQVLTRDVAWDRGLDQLDEKTVLVFLALHGGKDAEGPYLLRHDADLRDGEACRLRLQGVIKRLAELPTKQNKVLVLDATQVPSDWGHGMLHNDFARGLADLRPQIEAVPNLLVLSASDLDQRSWASDEWRQTAFTHYLIEGLKGGADRGHRGRITARELYQYVRENVEKWARDNRDALQTPVLLGGQERAEQIELCAVPLRYEPAHPEVPAFQPPADLAAAWKRYHALEKQVPPPWTYTPDVWQLYQAKLLRYEQLVLAGERRVAPAVRQELDRLADELDGAARAPLASAQNTLAMPAALALTTPWTDQELDGWVAQLWDAKAGERAALVRQWESQASDMWGRRLLRLRLAGRVLQRAAENPSGDLPRAFDLLPVLGADGNERPAELHFLAMLRHLDPERQPGSDDLRLALRVRRMAEDVALAVEADEVTGRFRARTHPYSEQVFPWIRAKVEQADRDRQLGQDLLFATDADSWQEARAHLQRARQLCREAQTDAAQVREALAVRDEVLAKLPAYSAWLAGLRRVDEPVRALVSEVEQLWSDVHALARLLEEAHPEAPRPGDLVNPTRQIRARFQALQERFAAHCRDLADSQGAVLQGLWRQIHEALVVPQMDPEVRRRLLQSLREVSRGLHDRTVWRFSGAAPMTPECNEELARDQARRQGRLSLAALGERWFDDAVHFPNAARYRDVASRVERLTTDPAWAESADAVGAATGLRWRRLPEAVAARTAEARTLPLAEAAERLVVAERLARQAGPVFASLLTGRPAEEARRLRLHDLLVWQAERTLADHWYGDDPQGEPYYRLAGLRYTRDARDLAGASANDLTAPQRQARLASAGGIEERLRRRGDLVPEVPKPIDLTSERRLTVRYVLRPTAQGWVPPGYAVAWAKTERFLDPLRPGRQRLDIRDRQSAPVVADLVPVRAGPPARLPRVDETAVALEGFYRGQVIRSRTPVRLHRAPDTVWTEHPTGGLPAAVAVRATPDVLRRFAPQNAAVAIVLDYSGSMRAPVDGADLLDRNTPCKIKEALDALEEVLSQLDPGTTVSIWIFGQSGPPGSRTIPDVEKTIQMVRTPSVWSGQRQELRDLMDHLRPPALQPWNETPLIRALWTAKERGFPRDFKGFKTVIALTDGLDNRFAQDTELQRLHQNKLAGLPPGQKMARFIEEEFKDTGVQINLVGFRVDEPGKPAKEAEELFRKQFSVIGKLSVPGKIYTAERRDRLIADLKKAVRRELRFFLEREDGGAMPPQFREGGQVSSDPRGDRWLTPLEPGAYRVRVLADRVLPQRVHLEPGDCLLVTVAGDGDNLHFEPVRLGASASLSVAKDGWLLAAHQDQRLPDGSAQLLLSVENGKDGPAGRSERLWQVKPRAVWLEVGAPGRGGVPALRWGNLPGYPAPAWDVTLPDWSARAAAADRPAVTAWLNGEDEPRCYAREFDRGADFETFFTRAGNREVRVKDPRNQVVIESVTVEPFDVESAPGGVARTEPCLVVRLRYTTGHPVWADVKGLSIQGKEHRFYAHAGKYTGLFWPVTRDDVQHRLQAIHVIPADEFKDQETTRRLQLHLNPPDPSSIRPQPALPGPEGSN